MMGWIVLVIALTVEIILAGYCMYTRSVHSKLRSIVRLSSLAAFVFFTLLSVIEWGFSWVMLAILLLVSAVAGAWRLLRNHKPDKPYKASRVISGAIAMMLLVTFTLIPAIVFPQYQVETTGRYKIATTTYTYTDEERVEPFTDTGQKRQVTVDYWYPEGADGTYPLILFSHGAFGIGASNTSAYEELASNGYVVGSISHTYHAMATVNTNNKLTLANKVFIQEVFGMNSDQYTEQETYALFGKWMELRNGDIQFVLDTILNQVGHKNSESMYPLIDSEKIGLIGHSMGGSAVTAVSRERDDIDAVINLDAPLYGELTGYQGDEMTLRKDAYPLPLLNVYSDDLWGKMDLDSLYLGNAQMLTNTPKHIYNVHFEGAKHLSLTDLSLFSPMLANMLQGGKADIDKYYCIETLNQVILSFSDAYVKGLGDFTPQETY